MGNLTDTCDAIASDISANAVGLGLPSFQTQLYAKPLIENVEQLSKPILAVFPFGADPVPLSTDGTYEWPDVVTIGWFEPVPESIETGIVDPVKAKAALDRAQSLIDHVKGYYAAVPGLSAENEATVVRVRYGKVRGGVFACEISVKVTTWI